MKTITHTDYGFLYIQHLMQLKPGQPSNWAPHRSKSTPRQRNQRKDNQRRYLGLYAAGIHA